MQITDFLVPVNFGSIILLSMYAEHAEMLSDTTPDESVTMQYFWCRLIGSCNKARLHRLRPAGPTPRTKYRQPGFWHCRESASLHEPSNFRGRSSPGVEMASRYLSHAGSMGLGGPVSIHGIRVLLSMIFRTCRSLQ